MASRSSRAKGFLPFYEELLRTWTRRLGNRPAAEDLSHDTLLKCLEADDAAVREPRAYLHQTARNLVIDQHRREGGVELLPLDIIAAHPSRLGDPVSQARSGQLTQDLERALAELPEKCRQVFLWQRLEGLTQAEIAERMGLSKNMVEKHMIRALRHLRQRLSAHAPH